jgi:hypothetical protein
MDSPSPPSVALQVGTMARAQVVLLLVQPVHYIRVLASFAWPASRLYCCMHQ